jgi:hypothetical protein
LNRVDQIEDLDTIYSLRIFSAKFQTSLKNLPSSDWVKAEELKFEVKMPYCLIVEELL